MTFNPLFLFYVVVDEENDALRKIDPQEATSILYLCRNQLCTLFPYNQDEYQGVKSIKKPLFLLLLKLQKKRPLTVIMVTPISTECTDREH